MKTCSIEQLVDSWLNYTNESTELAKDQYSAAYEAVQRYLRDDHTVAWQFIQSAYKRDMSEKAQLVFACGPLEEFIHYHACQYIEQIESLARADTKFTNLLGGVWYRDTVPPDIWKRIETLRGEPWAR